MTNERNQDHIPLQKWHCAGCDKPVRDKPNSASRPPNHNTVYCSCGEGGVVDGLAAAHKNPTHNHEPFPTLNTTSYPYDGTTIDAKFQIAPLHFVTGHVPPSNNSTNMQDIPCQEGIETHQPQLIPDEDSYNTPRNGPLDRGGLNHFIEVAPLQTDNERKARRSFSRHYTYSFSIQRFLDDPEQGHSYNDVFASSPPSMENIYALPAGFVKQGMEFRDTSLLAAGAGGGRSSRRSKQSQFSSGEGSGVDRSWFAFTQVDPVLGAGEWMDRDGDVYECGGEGGYPSDISLLLELEES